MADVTMTEAQFLGALGDSVLNLLNTLIEEFEREADSLFYGQDVADFLYEKGANLQAKFQAKIDVLESGLTFAESQAQEAQSE